MASLKNQIKKIKTEEGVTLVELLAAIAILAIIVTSFLALFVQAGNTNNRTDKVNEATYLAQNEMEEVTRYSVENQHGSDRTLVKIKDELEFNDRNIRVRNPEGTDFTITTTLIEPTDESELYTVRVKVTEGGSENALAKMETRLLFTDPETDTEP